MRDRTTGRPGPMTLALLGATGRIGSHVLRQALDAGHEVTVLARDPARLGDLAAHPALRVVQGDLRDPDRVAAAVRGAEAVISAVGPSANAAQQVDVLRSGMRHTIAAMRRHGVRRIVNLSGAGISAPDDRKPLLDRIASRIVRVLASHVVAAKQAEYDELAASDLDWVAVRPPLVNDGPRTGRYVAGPDALRPGARISRADVAHYMLAQAVDPSLSREAPFIRS